MTLPAPNAEEPQRSSKPIAPRSGCSGISTSAALCLRAASHRLLAWLGRLAAGFSILDPAS